jgi:hypothetical protein
LRSGRRCRSAWFSGRGVMPPSKREPGDSTGAGEDRGLDGRARAS